MIVALLFKEDVSGHEQCLDSRRKKSLKTFGKCKENLFFRLKTLWKPIFVPENFHKFARVLSKTRKIEIVFAPEKVDWIVKKSQNEANNRLESGHIFSLSPLASKTGHTNLGTVTAHQLTVHDHD